METGKRFMQLVLGAMLLLFLLLGLAPTQAQAAPNITSISAGVMHTCALTGADRVWCWGMNQSGQLGNGESGSGKLSAAPVRVLNLDGVKAISAGNEHNCALKEGTVWCWGHNRYGQLGNGQSGFGNVSATPVRVLNLSGVKAISAGYWHTCALTAAGTVWCWGLNEYGELGNARSGEGKYSATPVRVLNLSGVKAISGGGAHTCALMSGGTIKCWGQNWHGELGNGQSGSGKLSATPVPVKDQGGTGLLSGVTAISAGGDQTCALATADRTLCWGGNWYGQLGNGQSGSTNHSDTPVRVLNLSGVTAIGGGSAHTCALASAGTVWCWGYNSSGELGNGQSGNISATPVRVLNLSGVTAVDTGGGHTCALKGGAVWCWGENWHGQLGNGQSGVGKLSTTPVAVVWPTTSQ